MRIIRTLLYKEFKQIIRNRFILPVIIVVPLVQMILLTYAASLEMKGIKMAVVDEDHSSLSRLLVFRISVLSNCPATGKLRRSKGVAGGGPGGRDPPFRSAF
jgi:ABC-2 type transport system permease protein